MVGRHLPTPNDETPQIYRMKLWATDAVRAKSKFWCVALVEISNRNSQLVVSVDDLLSAVISKWMSKSGLAFNAAAE